MAPFDKSYMTYY